jgi:hypothetical protein
MAGTYRTVKFKPALTYSVPTGWANDEDNVGNFTLAPPGVSLSDAEHATSTILVWTRAEAAGMNCTARPDPKPPLTAKGIAQWLAHHAGVTSTQPRPVAIGGLVGYVLSVHLAPRGGIRCAGIPNRNAPLLDGWGQSGGQFWISGPPDRALVYLLNFHGLPLAIIADSNGQHPPSLTAEAKVIGDFHFARA